MLKRGPVKTVEEKALQFKPVCRPRVHRARLETTCKASHLSMAAPSSSSSSFVSGGSSLAGLSQSSIRMTRSATKKYKR